MTILVAQPDQNVATIPAWVTDLQSFRRWALSEEYPQSGWYSHLGGELWVDTNMEQLGHNKLKGKIAATLTTLVEERDSGQFFHDRMMLIHVGAGIGTEPDGMYVSHDAISSGRVRLEKGAQSLEVIGTPDMVLEVVSPYSGRKDRVVLPELYHKAGIREYWIVQTYMNKAMFDLLVWQPDGYIAAPDKDGWKASPVFGKEYQFEVTEDRLGFPVYHLKAQ